MDKENTTIKLSDKNKVARIIADMLGVEKADSMSPEAAITAGLRTIKSKRMTPELMSILKKMLSLADSVGIKIDKKLLPKSVMEGNLKFKEFFDRDISTIPEKIVTNKSKKPIVTKSIKDTIENGEVTTETGHTLDGPVDDDTNRRMKVNYLQQEEIEHDDISEKDLDKMVDSIDEPDDILDVYDDHELEIVDIETGEVCDEKDEEVNEEVLSEVLSRAARMKAKVKFLQTKSKRARKLKIALKTRSNSATINQRARKLAIMMLKQRWMKKPVQQMSIAEKERAEAIIHKKKALVDRLAMKLVPRIKKIENNRLSPR